MKTKLADLHFSDCGEGTIRLNQAFFDADWVTQADALLDWAAAIDKIYWTLIKIATTKATQSQPCAGASSH